MKSIKKFLLGTLVLFSLQFGWGGCIVDGGGHYHDGGSWFHDGPWLDGGGWSDENRDDERRDIGPGDEGTRGHVDIDIHPPWFARQ